MSRKITHQIVEAFMSGKALKIANTETDGSSIRLHGNLIAIKESNIVYVSNAGWFSNTTKERLNGIPGVRIHQAKGVWYLNGVEWDGKGEFFNGNFHKI